MSIREKWDEIVRHDYGGDYAAADATFPADEEAKQDAIEARHQAIEFGRSMKAIQASIDALARSLEALACRVASLERWKDRV